MPLPQFVAQLNAVKTAMAEAFAGTATAEVDQFGAAATAVSNNVAGLQQKIETAKQAIADFTEAQKAGILVDDNGIDVTAGLAAAKVTLSSAEKSLATALGETTKAVKPAIDSWAALLDQQTKNEAAYTNAYNTYTKLMDAYAKGIPIVDGIAVNTRNLEIATTNLANATKNLTGEVQAWQGSASDVETAVRNITNQQTILSNNTAIAQAAYDALQKKFQEVSQAGGDVATAYANVSAAGKLLTAAQAAQTKATQDSGKSFEELG